MAALHIEHHPSCPAWNYTIRPRTQRRGNSGNLCFDAAIAKSKSLPILLNVAMERAQRSGGRIRTAQDDSRARMTLSECAGKVKSADWTWCGRTTTRSGWSNELVAVTSGAFTSWTVHGPSNVRPITSTRAVTAWSRWRLTTLTHSSSASAETVAETSSD